MPPWCRKKADFLDMSMKDWVICSYAGMALEAVTVNRLPTTAPSTVLRGALGAVIARTPSQTDLASGELERTRSQFKAKFWDGDAAMPSPSFPSDHAMVVAKVTLKQAANAQTRRCAAGATARAAHSPLSLSSARYPAQAEENTLSCMCGVKQSAGIHDELGHVSRRHDSDALLAAVWRAAADLSLTCCAWAGQAACRTEQCGASSCS